MIDDKELDEYIKQRQYRLINSVLVWQDDKIILKRYYNGFNENSRNVMRSVVKSILSIAAGICIDRGLIKSVDDKLYRYLDEFDSGLNIYHRAITIKHLLTMTSGIYWTGGVHYHCPLLTRLFKSNNWIEFIAENDVATAPGSTYNYSEFDIILLTAVIQKVTGMDIYDFVNENIYKTLDIKSGPWWKRSNIGYSCATGGEGNKGVEECPSNLTALEMLRIGMIFCKNGIYNDKRIISKEYIYEAITPSAKNSHYGYLWWLYDEGYYGCRGFGGQNITVIPNQNKICVLQATPTSRGKEYDDVIKLLI